MAPKGAVFDSKHKPCSLKAVKFFLIISFAKQVSPLFLREPSSSSLSSFGIVASSYHSMSSSVPSVELEMPHFLNGRTTISSGRLRHASKTQEDTVANEAALTFPAGVRLFSPSIVQLLHLSRIPSLNGLLRQTSSGCRMLVNPPGITAISVFVWRSACFARSARWA